MNQTQEDADPGLTPAQLAALGALLDTFVPPSGDARMPGAGELPQVVRQVAQLAATAPAMRSALDLLDTESLAHCGAPFVAADEGMRTTLLAGASARQPDVFRQLALETVTCYYQQDAVLEALGLEARPPFPGGYQVLSGDLMLLNPVRARGRIYRDAGEA